MNFRFVTFIRFATIHSNDSVFLIYTFNFQIINEMKSDECWKIEVSSTFSEFQIERVVFVSLAECQQSSVCIQTVNYLYFLVGQPEVE